jgi:hypothetical protein
LAARPTNGMRGDWRATGTEEGKGDATTRPREPVPSLFLGPSVPARPPVGYKKGVVLCFGEPTMDEDSAHWSPPLWAYVELSVPSFRPINTSLNP